MTDTIHSCGYHCPRPGCVLAQRNELVAKVAELEKDAERYRWLKRNSGVSQGRMRRELKLVSICPTYGDERDVDNLDAAIDSAMQLK